MLKDTIRKIVNTIGYDIVPVRPPDMEEQFWSVYQKCKNFTATSAERMYTLYKATQYIVEHSISGDIVECGVWRGGSMMLCALTLMAIGDTQRDLYLYDTYSGMTEPTEKDIDYKGAKVLDKWRNTKRDYFNKWCSVPLADVAKAMYSTGYSPKHILFVEGKVEDTIPKVMPTEIALLRLDTDWYESTYHELLHLFPRLSPKGVLIIDDYGHWKGSKEAVDRYFQENSIKILLNRIDYTGRIGIKP